MKNNPYVGPRPYERGDRHNFFGRDRDARDLVALILAEREVLFYAQSGAGKTSLLNAQVIPALEEEGFQVLPVTRVGSSLPPGMSDQAVSNIFVVSALMGLAGTNVPVEALPKHTLLSFLREFCLKPLDGVKRRPPLLILDQFEELFTTHQDRWKDAEGFFQQVREALDAEPSLGIVLAMREDHVAELDPYVQLLSHRLLGRYRMERLRYEAALEVVTQPAFNSGYPFEPGVAERLVENLCQIKVPGAKETGQEVVVSGRYVEAVQLQVVCQQLWENLPDATEGDRAIQWEEVERYGNIDRALTNFYEGVLSQTVHEAKVKERDLRRWFSTQLITPMQTRGLVLKEEKSTAGLPNEAVAILDKQLLIRADMRAGAWWYELVHDRLVDPILESNRKWEAARQTPLRTTAKQWQKTKSEGLLYRDKALKEASAWAKVNPDEVEPYEQAFLEASRQAEQVRLRRRRLFAAGIMATAVILVVMAALTVFAVKGQNDARAAQATAESRRQEADTARADADAQKALAITEATRADEQARIAVAEATRADEQARIARTERLAAQAVNLAQTQLDLALLLSIESNNIAATLDPIHRLDAKDSLLKTVAANPRLATILRGHTDSIASVAFSPNGKTLASGGFDGSVRLWDVASAQPIGRSVMRHTDWVRAVAFSPDGKILASGGQDGAIHLWNVTTRQEDGAPLNASPDSITSIAFSPDGRTLASGSWNGAIQLWDVTSRQPKGETLKGHTAWIHILIFSRDGKTLFSDSPGDANIVFWDVELGQIIGSPLKVYASSMALSPDGTKLAYGNTSGGYVRFLDVTSQKQVGLSINTGTPNGPNSMAFSPDGTTLASGGIDKVVKLWNVKTGQPVNQPLAGHTYTINALAFSPDGQTLASGSEDKTIRLWNLGSQNDSIQLPSMTSGVWSMAISPDRKVWAAGSRDGPIRLWDVETGQPIGQPLNGHSSSVTDVAFSPDSTILASCSQCEIRLWQVATGNQLPVIKACGHLAFSPDGKTLVSSGGGNNTVLQWDVATEKQIGDPIPGHDGIVTYVAFSPDGQILAVGGATTVQLWDLTRRQRIGLPLDHGESVMTLAFSSDGKMLATAGGDKTGGDKSIRLWDMATQKQIGATLVGHHGSVMSVMFSSDSTTLASGSVDGTVRLWDTTTGRSVGAPFQADASGIAIAAYSQDGKTIIAGDYGTKVWRWNIDLASSQERACHIANRNLTQAEWAQYINPDPSTYRPTCQELPLEPEPTPAPTRMP